MNGVIWIPDTTDDRLAPSRSTALAPTGGRSVVEHVVDALAPVVDSIALVSDDPDVRSTVAETAHAVEFVRPDDVSSVADSGRGHRRTLVASGSTYVESDAFAELTECERAVAIRTPDDESDAPALPPDATAHVLDRTELDGVDSREDLASTLADRHATATATAVACGERLFDVRRPWELLAANQRALESVERSVRGDVHPDADCRGNVVVEPGARIESGVVVEGPAFVADGATVGPNAYVRGATYVGPDVHVGHGVEVKNSVLHEGCAVPHLTYVGDSVVGPGANLGAGSLVANLRHDDEAVRLVYEGELVSTGRRKFGAVVGANARVGIGTMLNAGVTLAAGATTTPGETVFRDRDGDGEN